MKSFLQEVSHFHFRQECRVSCKGETSTMPKILFSLLRPFPLKLVSAVVLNWGQSRPPGQLQGLETLWAVPAWGCYSQLVEEARDATQNPTQGRTRLVVTGWRNPASTVSDPPRESGSISLQGYFPRDSEPHFLVHAANNC